MKKTELHMWGVIVSYALNAVMLGLLIFSIWRGQFVWIFGSALALTVSLIPAILKRNYQITLPLILDVLITLALLLHVGGGLLGGYDLPHYDTLTHFVSSFLVAFIAFVIIYILDEYWDGLIMDDYAMAFVVVLATVAMGVVWELSEWSVDMIFGTVEQWGYDDTVKDLFVDMLAGIVMAVLGVLMIKRGSFDELTEDLGEQLDKQLIQKQHGGPSNE